MSRYPRLIGLVTLGTFVTLGIGAGAQAPVSPRPDVMSELLAEVKGLRAAMEAMATSGPRVQLAFGRLQLQEQRVSMALRRLDSIRQELAAAQRELDEAAERQRTLQRMSREAADAEERRQAEMMASEFDRQLKSSSATLQRLQNEEIAAAGDVSNEQARWTDLNRMVEELERTLGRQ
jgi:hypothetical protein